MNTTRIVSPLLRRAAAARFQTTASAAKPFRILGVQQIAIGSVEKGPLRILWQDIFGFKPYASKRLEKENVEEDILKIGPAPYEIEVDLMTPIDPEGSPKVCPV
jgi:lactoylglutathione lyase